jgi:heme/copper-type cytochrome/quinol oxidase subunit 2
VSEPERRRGSAARGFVRAGRGKAGRVDTLVAIAVLVAVVVPVLIVLALFVWAARKDGEEDRALQRRLGIRRRTRLGR